MSTVKISELALISQLNANTQNTLFVAVDVPSGVTGKFTGRTLARGLFSNEVLNVGNNSIQYSNVIGQFSGNTPSFLQINLQNFNNLGSSDYVASTSDSDNANSFIDMGISSGSFSDPANYGAFKPYDGYVYVAGPTTTSYSGNLILGTASSNANIIFIAGGQMANNIVARMTANGLALNTQSYITFADGSRQSTSAAPFAYTNTVYSVANVGPFAFAQANAAFSKANNALANTTGTFAGDLTITGNTTAQSMNTGNLIVNGTTSVTGTSSLNGIVTMNAQVVLTNSTFSNTQSALRISATANVATPSNDGYMLHISGKQNVTSRIVSDSYGANTYVVYAGRSARGNVSNPTAVQSGDVLSRFSGNGYGATGWAQFGSARIDFVASENYTDVARGSQIQFWNVPAGSNTLTQIASFNGTSVTFTGVVNPEKGFIYTPRIPVGNQTAIAINYATDSMIKANLVADLTVSHSNFVTGKVVELWLVNTGGVTRTVTHGLTALNSVTNSTTFTIPGTSAAYLKYFSIDGDLANTFVSVVHA